MMSRKHKNFSTILKYIQHFLIFASAIPRCVSIDAFVSLLDITVVITSSVIGLKPCVITTAIKSYKSRKRRKESMIK